MTNPARRAFVHPPTASGGFFLSISRFLMIIPPKSMDRRDLSSGLLDVGFLESLRLGALVSSCLPGLVLHFSSRECKTNAFPMRKMRNALISALYIHFSTNSQTLGKTGKFSKK